jgi:hypothetical protein
LCCLCFPIEPIASRSTEEYFRSKLAQSFVDIIRGGRLVKKVKVSGIADCTMKEKIKLFYLAAELDLDQEAKEQQDKD